MTTSLAVLVVIDACNMHWNSLTTAWVMLLCWYAAGNLGTSCHCCSNRLCVQGLASLLERPCSMQAGAVRQHVNVAPGITTAASPLTAHTHSDTGALPPSVCYLLVT